MGKYYFIGIDPAFRKSGFCVCIIDPANTVEFKTFVSFLDFIEWCFVAPSPGNSYICVENSNLQDSTFDMSGSIYVVAKKSRHVGQNQAASQYTYDMCVKIWGKNAFQVSPREKGKKLNDLEFNSIVKKNKHTLLNYKGNKNEQDKRDAYKLALQAKQKAFRNKIKK
jgi:hypothetical protein